MYLFSTVEYSISSSDLDRRLAPNKSSKSRFGSKLKPSSYRRPKANNKKEEKTPYAVLYAFPSFDKCDSLIYLPTALTRHMNSGDISAMSKLLRSHLDKNCTVNLSFLNSQVLTVNMLIMTYKLMLDLHPDTLQVAHNIVVDGNKIRATVLVKYTDNVLIHESIRRTNRDPTFTPVLQMDRAEGWEKECLSAGRSKLETQQYLALATTRADLSINLSMQLELTVDDLTKKVAQFSMTGTVTSMQAI